MQFVSIHVVITRTKCYLHNYKAIFWWGFLFKPVTCSSKAENPLLSTVNNGALRIHCFLFLLHIHLFIFKTTVFWCFLGFLSWVLERSFPWTWLQEGMSLQPFLVMFPMPCWDQPSPSHHSLQQGLGQRFWWAMECGEFVSSNGSTWPRRGC